MPGYTQAPGSSLTNTGVTTYGVTGVPPYVDYSALMLPAHGRDRTSLKKDLLIVQNTPPSGSISIVGPPLPKKISCEEIIIATWSDAMTHLGIQESRLVRNVDATQLTPENLSKLCGVFLCCNIVDVFVSEGKNKKNHVLKGGSYYLKRIANEGGGGNVPDKLYKEVIDETMCSLSMLNKCQSSYFILKAVGLFFSFMRLGVKRIPTPDGESVAKTQITERLKHIAISDVIISDCARLCINAYSNAINKT